MLHLRAPVRSLLGQTRLALFEYVSDVQQCTAQGQMLGRRSDNITAVYHVDWLPQPHDATFLACYRDTPADHTAFRRVEVGPRTKEGERGRYMLRAGGPE